MSDSHSPSTDPVAAGAASEPFHAGAAPPDDEPKTPMWLPALGAALFVAGGIVWAVSASHARRSDGDAPQAATAASSAPVATDSAHPPPRPAAPPPPASAIPTAGTPPGSAGPLQARPGAAPSPGPSGSPARPRLIPRKPADTR